MFRVLQMLNSLFVTLETGPPRALLLMAALFMLPDTCKPRMHAIPECLQLTHTQMFDILLSSLWFWYLFSIRVTVDGRACLSCEPVSACTMTGQATRVVWRATSRHASWRPDWPRTRHHSSGPPAPGPTSPTFWSRTSLLLLVNMTLEFPALLPIFPAQRLVLATDQSTVAPRSPLSSSLPGCTQAPLACMHVTTASVSPHSNWISQLFVLKLSQLKALTRYIASNDKPSPRPVLSLNSIKVHA